MLAPAIRYEEAQKRLAEALTPVAGTENCPLADCLGRLSAEDVVSEIMLPQTTNAAVDGYAFAASSQQNEAFTIIGTAKAGHPFTGHVGANEAVRILTGAIMPDGADTVIMQEFCTVTDDQLTCSQKLSSGKNARPAGENLSPGEVLISRNEVITAAHIGQAAAAGKSSLLVYQPIKVGVFSTGDELRAPTQPLAAGQIYDSNRPLIISLLQRWGVAIHDYGIIADDEDEVRATLQLAHKECDLIICSGGASEGDEDHLQAALAKEGATSLFWRLAMKPGRPMAASQLGQTPILSLPGNPVAVYVCMTLFALPAVQSLMTGHFAVPRRIAVQAAFAAQKKPQERAEFIRVTCEVTEDGQFVAKPHGRKGAGVLSSLTGADGLAELPFEASQITEGDWLSVIPLPHLVS